MPVPTLNRAQGAVATIGIAIAPSRRMAISAVLHVRRIARRITWLVSCLVGRADKEIGLLVHDMICALPPALLASKMRCQELDKGVRFGGPEIAARIDGV